MYELPQGSQPAGENKAGKQVQVQSDVGGFLFKILDFARTKTGWN